MSTGESEDAMTEEIIDMSEWYTSEQACKRLTANSGKPIDSSYLRYLARESRVATKKLSERARLYKRADIDSYVVEARGQKVARMQRQRAVSQIPTKRTPGKPGRPRKPQQESKQ